MLVQGTVRRGARCSAAKAFLRSVKGRANLHISLRSHVVQVLIHPETKVAYGVKFVKDGRTRLVRARREVVVSGGTLNTPQLLMLSGVGPADHLRHLGIPVVSDLPVGRNLMDHYGTVALTATVDQPVTVAESRILGAKPLLDYLLLGREICQTASNSNLYLQPMAFKYSKIREIRFGLLDQSEYN